MRLFSLIIFALICASALSATECNSAKQQLAAFSRNLETGNIAAAEKILAQLQKTDAECLEVTLARARLAAATGRMAEAQDDFQSLINLPPSDSRSYSYYANFLYEVARYQEADTAVSKALEIDGDDPEALLVRGKILDRQGRSDESIATLERACQLAPSNSEAHLQLASVYHRVRRLADAVRQFKIAADLDLHDARTWDHLALDLERLGEIEQSDLAYRRGIEVNTPGSHFDAFIDYNYGRFLMKRNDLVASKKHLDRAVELAPGFRATWYERAKLNFRMNNYEHARDDAERADITRDPMDVIIDLQLYVLLEQIYKQLGDPVLERKYAELSRRTAVPVRQDSRSGPQ